MEVDHEGSLLLLEQLNHLPKSKGVPPAKKV